MPRIYPTPLPDLIEIVPLRTKAKEVVVQVPGSKSITNRALIIAALADGVSALRNALWSDDSKAMVECLRKLGIQVDVQEIPNTCNVNLTVHGCGGTLPNRGTKDQYVELYVELAGTAARFLTALVASQPGYYRVYGTERMHERPMGDLIEALRVLDVDVETEQRPDCLPVKIISQGFSSDRVSIKGNKSSQFTSALMLAAPALAHDFTINIDGEMVSQPFIGMSENIAEFFGAKILDDGQGTIRISGKSGYTARPLDVEPDATSASYFWMLPVMDLAESVAIQDFPEISWQGDSEFKDYLDLYQQAMSDPEAKAGAPVSLEVDFERISDTFLGAAVLVSTIPRAESIIGGIAHTRGQESDRVHAVATELTKLGVKVKEHPGALQIWGQSPEQFKTSTVETYKDHRMAMAFSILGLKIPGIKISNPACVTKTFPDFYDKLHQLGAEILDANTGRSIFKDV